MYALAEDVRNLLHKARRLLIGQEEMMAKIDEVNTGLSRIGAALDAIGARLAALETKVASGGEISSAQEDQLVGLTETLAAHAESLAGTLTPATSAPEPPPAPTA